MKIAKWLGGKWGRREEDIDIDIEFTEQKTYPENDENAIDFKWLDIQKDHEDIAKANLFEN